MGRLTNLLAAMLVGTMAASACSQECSSQKYKKPENEASQLFFCDERRKGYIPKPKTEEERAAHKLHQKKIKARRNKRRGKARR